MPATDGRTISINLQVLTDQLTSGFKKATTETKEWSSETQTSIAQVEQSTERISRLWRSMLEAFIGYEAIKGLLGIARAADDAKESIASAALTARNFGHSIDPGQMEAWLRAFANSAQGGGYQIDEMRQAVQEFSSIGMDGANIQRALADTASLAAAKNIDFAQSAHIVTMAYTGHVEMLTRYGIISREAAKGIHTVEEAFDAIEHATKGAAAERSERLAGALGRLGTAASLLRDKVGDALIPIFDAIAKALVALTNAFSAIPQPVLDAVVAFGAVATGAVAVTLILPAVWKGLQIVWEAFNLLLLPARAVGSFFIGPLIGAFAEVITWLGGLATALGTGTLAEWAFTMPIPSMIVACAALVGAIALVVTNLGTFEHAWRNSLDVMGTAFHEWVTTVGKGFMELGESLSKLFNAENAAQFKDAFNTLKQSWKDINVTVDPMKMGLGDAFKKDFSSNLKWAEGEAKSAFSNIFGFLNIKLPNIAIPHEPFPGNIPGGAKTKDNSSHQAEDALKNFEEGFKELMAIFEARVADARHILEKSTTAVDQYRAGLPGGEPQNQDQGAELAKLMTNELRAQQTLHDRLVDQQKVELQAQGALEKYAASISTHLKNHDELVRAAKDAALQHVRAAQQLGEEYLKIGATVAKIKGDIKAAFAEGVDNARDTTNENAETDLSSRNLNRNLQGENDSRQLAIDKATHGSAKPVEEDRVKIALDQLAVSAAADTESIRQEELARARVAYNLTGSLDDLKKLKDAQNALTQATIDATRAEDQRSADQAKLTADLNQKWNQLIDNLIQKVNVPGLSGSAQAGFSFNPLAMLMEAFAKTQSFADIMNTVTAIVNTFAQALDAFRPIIDALLDVVRAVVNVFIFLYNVVARILDLFGLQIQQLQYLTDAMSGLVPLISIVHEIPTLNELAAGRLNSPLSTTPVGNNTLGQSNGGQNTLMRVVEVLTGILAAIVIEKLISGMSLTQAVQQTMHLLGINIGQKVQTAAQQTTLTAALAGNAIMTTGFTTANGLLMQILAALQAGALSGGGGFFGAILKGLGGAASTAAAASSTSGLLGPLAQVGQAISNLSNAINSHVGALSRATTELCNFTSSLQTAGSAANRMAFAGGGNVTAISSALSLDTSRRMGSAGYGIDRVPM